MLFHFKSHVKNLNILSLTENEYVRKFNGNVLGNSHKNKMNYKYNKCGFRNNLSLVVFFELHKFKIPVVI